MSEESNLITAPDSSIGSFSLSENSDDSLSAFQLSPSQTASYNICNHSFIPHTFTKFTYCSLCSSLIWGLFRQGVRCKGCSKALHYHCLGPYMHSPNSNSDSAVFDQLNISQNLDPLSLDETLSWVEQIFQNANMEPDTFLVNDSQNHKSSYMHIPETQMSFIQKIFYKTTISYKTLNKNSLEMPKLNLLTTTPRNFIRMLYRIGPVFDFKDSLLRISWSNNPLLFICILLMFNFICYYPFFLLYLPFIFALILFCFQLFMRSINFKVPGIPDDPSCSGGLLYFRKILEDGKGLPLKRNLMELQNTMGNYADFVDHLLSWISYYMVEDSTLILIKWVFLIISFMFFYLFSKYVSTNTLFAITGSLMLVFSHPWIRCFLHAIKIISLDYVSSTLQLMS